MKTNPTATLAGPEDEIAVLVRDLHETQMRLQELTGGEVDAVVHPGGHLYLLQEAQEKLRESNEKFHLLGEELRWKTAFLEAQVNCSLDGILVVDGRGRKILQNPRLGDLLSIPRHIAEDQDDEQQVRWVTNATKNPEQFIEKVLYLYSHPNEISRDELELKDGTILDRYSSPVVGKDGKYYGRIWTFRDITERKQAEEALKESESRYHSLFENMLEGYALCRMLREPGRALDFIYLEVNDAFEKLTGLTNVVGKKVSQVIPGIQETDRELLETYTRVASTGRPERIETHLKSLGFWFSVSVYSHQKEHFVVVFDNISERKRAEAELEKTHKELLEKSHQAGMAEFATGVLHNVGNVLNSVNVAASCLADNLGRSKAADLFKVAALLREHGQDLGGFFTNDPRGRKVPAYLAQLAEHLAGEQAGALAEVAHLQKNIEHIKDIVTTQQGLAKRSGLTEFLNVNDLVEDALKMNSSALARGDIEVIKEFAALPLFKMEKHKVLQILVNLVRNATDAFAATDISARRLIIRTTSRADRVRIEVCDNGVGILSENLTRIFSHGFTTKKDGHGFGLQSGALAAKAAGGSLAVHSEGPGHGATFTLELPLQLPRAAHE